MTPPHRCAALRIAAWPLALALLCACSDPARQDGDTTSRAAAGGSGGSAPGGGDAAGPGGAPVGAGGAGGGDGGDGGSAVPLDGFGSIDGACGELDPSELAAMAPPFELYNAIDFSSSGYSRDVLSPGGQVLFDNPNAGGSSKESEIIAYEMLYRCELAALVKTETQIVYDEVGSITDMLVEIDGLRIGVSVVRAYVYMAEYTVADALDILTEKLADIQESSQNVSAADAWSKQILHVIAEKPENAGVVQQALPQIDTAVRGDTIVVVTVTNGDDAFIY